MTPVAGDARPRAPFGRALDARVARAIEGSYRLSDSSQVRVDRVGDDLRMTPDGPLAVELLAYGADSVGRAGRLVLATRTQSMLRRLCEGDPGEFRSALRRPSERLESFLRSAVCADPRARVHIIGTVPRWWSASASHLPATLFDVATATGNRRLRIEWENNQITAIGGGGISSPAITLIASTVRRELIGYNPILDLSIHVAPGGSPTPKFLELRTATGERAAAQRVP